MMISDYIDYPENSRAAILRVAILVVYSDGSWHELERRQLESVYRNICVMLDDDLEEDQFLLELEEISSEVTDQIENFADEEEAEAYWEMCLGSIVSEDIQQLTVGAALALSTGDSEIDANEMSAIVRLGSAWRVSVKDAEEIWND
jgi:tellurite resistance protein